MSREYKKFQLQNCNKPTKSRLLVSTVAVRGKEGQHCYCYVSFSDKLVESVGKKLPRGLREDDPAYLAVVYDAGYWVISAVYAVDGIAAELWRTEYASPPTWLKFHKLKVKNGRPAQSKAGS